MPTDILDKAKVALEGCDADGVVACYCDESGRCGLPRADPSTDSGWIPACAGMTEVSRIESWGRIPALLTNG